MVEQPLPAGAYLRDGIQRLLGTITDEHVFADVGIAVTVETRTGNPKTGIFSCSVNVSDFSMSSISRVTVMLFPAPATDIFPVFSSIISFPDDRTSLILPLNTEPFLLNRCHLLKINYYF